MRALFLLFVLSVNAYSFDVSVSTRPLYFFSGGASLEGQIGMGDFSLGAGVSSLSSNETEQDLDSYSSNFKERSLSVLYWFNGVFVQGFYTGVRLSQLDVDISFSRLETDRQRVLRDVDYEGVGTATGYFANIGYRWAWDTFFMDLGFLAGQYDFNDFHIKSDDGMDEDAFIPRSEVSSLNFSMGARF